MASTWGIDDIQGLISLGGIIVVAITGGIGYGALSNRVTRAAEDIEDMKSSIDSVARGLSTFTADAERRFVTEDTLSRVEGRIVAAIDKLGDRLDRVIDKKQ